VQLVQISGERTMGLMRSLPVLQRRDATGDRTKGTAEEASKREGGGGSSPLIRVFQHSGRVHKKGEEELWEGKKE